MSDQPSQRQQTLTPGAIVTACFMGLSFLLSVFIDPEVVRTVFFFTGILLGGLFVLLYWLPLIKRERNARLANTVKDDPISNPLKYYAVPPSRPTDEPAQPQVQTPIQASPKEPLTPPPVVEKEEVAPPSPVAEEAPAAAPTYPPHTPTTFFQPTTSAAKDSSDANEPVTIYEELPPDYNGDIPIAKIALYSDTGLTPEQIQRKKELVRWREKDLITEKEFYKEIEKLTNPKSKKRR